jgi:protein-S-isoprenylcysteine O-methyltransferase Ste14
MARVAALLYGVICYFLFFGTFLYAIWFVWTMDGAAAKGPLTQSILIDAVLLGIFAVQHSVMARQGFKRAWTKIVPRAVERSTYVLFASTALFAVVYFWQPLPGVIWNIQISAIRVVLHVLFWAAWANLVLSTFLINHFELFGLYQVWGRFRGQTYSPPSFKTPGMYQTVRHPIYLSFVVAFWSAPTMTVGHLFFAVMCTGYILVAIQLEERDLVKFHGEQYAAYKKRVSMLIPWAQKK